MINNKEIKEINEVLVGYYNNHKSSQAGEMEKDYNFYLNWDALMDTVENIEQSYGLVFTIELSSCTVEDDADVFYYEGSTRFEAIYRACYGTITSLHRYERY
jgi:hypothetical protein